MTGNRQWTKYIVCLHIMDTCVRCQLMMRTIRLGNVEECCNFSEVSTECLFFSLKKVALKLRHEKNVRGGIWGAGTWWNRVLEKRAVWAKVPEDDYLLRPMAPRRAVWLPWRERGGQGTWSQSAPGGAQLWVPYLTSCPFAPTLLKMYGKNLFKKH